MSISLYLYIFPQPQLKVYGVEVKQVVIANVQLPGGIVMNMQSETTFEAKQTEQRKKQQFELKVLNDNNYLLKIKLVSLVASNPTSFPSILVPSTPYPSCYRYY